MPQTDAVINNSARYLQLASKSPRRAELLSQIGVPYKVVSANVEEIRAENESPFDYVNRLAREKAQDGFSRTPDMPTLGSDTIVVCEGQVLEKPRDEDHAVEMLMRLSGKEQYVYTALAIVSNEKIVEAHSQTSVTFRAISEPEARRYWQTGEPADKAGGYAIQGLGAVFVKQIKGSYSAVVGLPIEVLAPLLEQFDIPYWK